MPVYQPASCLPAGTAAILLPGEVRQGRADPYFWYRPCTVINYRPEGTYEVRLRGVQHPRVSQVGHDQIRRAFACDRIDPAELEDKPDSPRCWRIAETLDTEWKRFWLEYSPELSSSPELHQKLYQDRLRTREEIAVCLKKSGYDNPTDLATLNKMLTYYPGPAGVYFEHGEFMASELRDYLICISDN